MRSESAPVHVEDACPGPRSSLVSEFKVLWAQGAAANARDFLSSHPELQGDQSLVLDLAYEEYCLRREAGQTLDPDEFCLRFPVIKSSLRELIETHRLLAASVSLGAGGLPTGWPEPGDHFLGFALQRELGRGAFARVFLARETALGDRPVAVKISFQGAAEAGILGRLGHPNIVPVHSVQEDPVQGLTVVCMPYLGCATLCDVLHRAFSSGFPSGARIILGAARVDPLDADLIADRQLPAPLLQNGTYVDGVSHLAAQLADALAFAHAQGVYHRDLKPSNVLLTPDGKPMLLDFNLSFDERLADQKLGGTLPYMAPELLLATGPDRATDPASVGAHADLYSLGIILYELLTGSHPFGPIPPTMAAGPFRKELLQRQKSGHQSLRQVNPAVDPALARVVDRCLAFDPKDRPQSAGELARALRKITAPWRRARRWLVGHARTIVAAALVILAAGLGTGYALSLREPAHLRSARAGMEAYVQEQYLEAVEHFSRAIAADPENPWYWFARARAYQRQATLDWIKNAESPLFWKALDDYTEADQRTQDGRIMFCIGVNNGFLSNHMEAIKAYNRAIAAGFVSAEVFNNLGYSHLQKEELELARKSLDQAIALKPDQTLAYHNRAWVGFRQMIKSGLEKTTLESMIADIRRVLASSQPCPEAAEVYHDAAKMYALAARYDDEHIGAALAAWDAATRHGQNPKSLRKALVNLSRGKLQSESLIAGPTIGEPLKALRIGDALSDMPADALLGN
jgi:serine/threonine protein kinase/Tfp pilus assembly protein PilF